MPPPPLTKFSTFLGLTYKKSWYSGRVYMVRESQGETGLFCFGQGKSEELVVVKGKIAFSFCRSGKSFIFHHQRTMYNTLITR